MAIKDEHRPIVIAMKGHPGTGKSTLAAAVARALRYPLIDKDHFRDGTLAVQQALDRATSPAMSAQMLNSLSYDVMWRVASAQLGLGLSVVVDSPLSRRSHLDRLLELAAGRVVVVECRPRDEAEWRRRVEARGGGGGGGGGGMTWHKPGTWREMEGLLEGYGGCWDYDVGDVPKIVVDTTGGFGVEELVCKVIEFLKS